MSNDELVGEERMSQTISDMADLGLETDGSAPSIMPQHHETGDSSLNGAIGGQKAATVAVAVDPVALITTECITVTSAMRKHARWAHSSVSAILGGGSSAAAPAFNSRPATPRDELASRKSSKAGRVSHVEEGLEDDSLANRWGLRGKKGKSMQDNPLMAGFGRLRRELQGCKGMVELGWKVSTY